MGGCLSDHKTVSKEMERETKATASSKTPSIVATKPSIEIIQPLKLQKSKSSHQPSHSDIATKYREALKPEIMAYVPNLPNSIFKTTNPQSELAKFRRLASEILKFPQYLPCEHTNAIFVRVDQTQLNSMNILISGPSGTPYAHGLYHFELNCDDSFPASPPKMQLLTGKGKVRFNPNLYQNGYICLSLLGTWRGDANQSWNGARSTLLQIFLSIQSLILNQGIYFNEPGYQFMKNTVQGNLCNIGYCNVVKLANIRYAMIEMIKKPPIGFENVVKHHFWIKKDEILADCERWLSQKNLPSKNCNQNHKYESVIASNGYGNLLEKQMNDLRTELMNLAEV